jgi:uncharacterized protein (DUF1800 family)
MASLNPLTGNLGKRLAAHLLRRTTYVATKANIDTFANMSASNAVDVLINVTTPTIAEPIDYKTGQPWINSGVPADSGQTPLRDYVKGWWINEARLDLSIGHKMMFFHHSNWVTAPFTGSASQYFDYLGLLRHYAIGNYKEFALKMTLDNRMLQYLDNTSNDVGNPNENYAREFFELFTIGKGQQIGPGNYTNFTEADIVEAAKLLTGWKHDLTRTIIDSTTGLPTGTGDISLHDTTTKQFSSAFGNTTIVGGTTTAGMLTELTQFIDMVYNELETAKHVCRRLYRYFVHSNITPEIETDIITPLANTLLSNGYELEPILKTLFKSEHFYDEDDSNNTDEIIGGLIKSPLELFLHVMTFFDIAIPDHLTDPQNHYRSFYRDSVINSFLLFSGMNIFYPVDVAGYPAYYQAPTYTKNWFNSSTLISRYKIGEMFLTGNRLFSTLSLNAQLDFVDFVANSGVISDPTDPIGLVTELVDYLFPELPDTNRLNYFVNDILLDNLSTMNWVFEWNNYITTNNDAAVKIPLNQLFEAILYSQEFQLM